MPTKPVAMGRGLRAFADVVVVIVFLETFAEPAMAAPRNYYLVPLVSPRAAPDGSYESRGLAVNNSGRVVGSADLYQTPSEQPTWGVSWSPAGVPDIVLDPLSDPSGQRSAASAINDSGVIIGRALQSDGSGSQSLVAARWLPGSSTPIALPTPGSQISGFDSSSALAINASGMMAGRVDRYDEQGNYRGQFAVRWDPNNFVMTDLDFIGFTSSGVSSAAALGINDIGTTVGSALAYSGGFSRGERAVRWDAAAAAATVLGNLGTNLAGTSRSEAYAINNDGTVVGYSNVYSGNTFLGTRAVRWEAGSTIPIELAGRGLDISGKTTSYASAINDLGQMVGRSFGYDQAGNSIQDGGAAFWDTDGTVYGLASLVTNLNGWILFEGRDISDTGYITGYGRDADGNDSAFLLILVPEPESFTLLALGALAVGTLRLLAKPRNAEVSRR